MFEGNFLLLCTSKEGGSSKSVSPENHVHLEYLMVPSPPPKLTDAARAEFFLKILLGIFSVAEFRSLV